MLMALEANLVIAGKGVERTVPIQTFYRNDGARHTMLEPGELVKEIIVPINNSNSYTAFIKTSQRQGIDFSTGTIAAKVTMSGKTCMNIQLILGSLISVPCILKEPALIVQEGGLSEEAINRAAMAATMPVHDQEGVVGRWMGGGVGVACCVSGGCGGGVEGGVCMLGVGQLHPNRDRESNIKLSHKPQQQQQQHQQCATTHPVC